MDKDIGEDPTCRFSTVEGVRPGVVDEVAKLCQDCVLSDQ